VRDAIVRCAEGIYGVTWPEIPPEVRSCIEQHAQARWQAGATVEQICSELAGVCPYSPPTVGITAYCDPPTYPVLGYTDEWFLVNAGACLWQIERTRDGQRELTGPIYEGRISYQPTELVPSEGTVTMALRRALAPGVIGPQTPAAPPASGTVTPPLLPAVGPSYPAALPPEPGVRGTITGSTPVARPITSQPWFWPAAAVAVLAGIMVWQGR
jgi:hypothetical protein